MTAQAPELAAVVARLEKVEQQNRKLKRVGVVVLALAVAGMVMGQAMPRARILEAREFLLKDPAGKVRGTLSVDKAGPGLALVDENGKLRAALAVYKDGPRLGLLDENEKLRVELAAVKAGLWLDLYDENGKPRVGLRVDKDGPMLRLLDENGKTIWRQP
jgi:hypothetical protein